MSLLLRTSLLLALGVMPFAVPAAKNDQSADEPVRNVTVSQEGSEIVHFCNELENVRFVGSNNSIEVEGPCRSVSIVGSSNFAKLRLQPEQVSVAGNDNKVHWAAADRGKPATTINGRGNVVEVQKDE